ncbi:lysostaphin resistance A-like protein [Mariniluteicoccus flavus]
MAATVGRAAGSPPEAGTLGLPPSGALYPRILTGGFYGPVIGVVCFLVAASAWLLSAGLVGDVVLRIAHAVGHRDVAYADFATAARGFHHWEGMLAAHLSIAILIPISWALVRFVHRLRGGWLVSVWAAPRWRYLAACFLISLVVFGTYVSTLPLRGQPLQLHPQQGFWAFLVVILLTSPLQAIAEEVFFRGYLLQAFGGLARTPWVGIVASALVFALFHGTQNVPLFVSRFVFGLLAGWLVVRTGGLEAGIAAHVVNNVFAFTLAGLTSTIAAARGLTVITWTAAFGDVLTFAAVALGAAVVARLMAVPNTVPARLGQAVPDGPENRA